MAISTTAAFLEALDKSELLEPEQLAAAREAARDADDPQVLARKLVQQGLLTRWQAGQLLIERPSFLVGKYRLIDLLGKGGMGKIFLARHVMMNRPVALKMVSRQLSQDPASLERFWTEARAAASLDHPNIVHAYSVDSEGDQYYMVMEYVEGRDLQRIIESEGPLDFDLAVDYLEQAAEGLAHAHAKGMVHCDIKPANLLVNPQGVVKILDLGMAKFSGDENGGDDRVLGTVDYMAPEQAVQSPDMDHRADIYALGCTLYFLLTGHPPFPEGTLHERILKHQTQEPRGILEDRPTAPRDLVRICQKMMAKEPGDRFQSAEELSRELSEWRINRQRLRKAVPLSEEEVAALKAQQQAEPAAASASPKTPDLTSLLDLAGVPDPGPGAAAPLSPLSAVPKAKAKTKESSPSNAVLLVGAVSGLVVLLVLGLALVFLVRGREPAERPGGVAAGPSATPQAAPQNGPGPASGRTEGKTQPDPSSAGDSKASEKKPPSGKPKKGGKGKKPQRDKNLATKPKPEQAVSPEPIPPKTEGNEPSSAKPESTDPLPDFPDSMLPGSENLEPTEPETSQGIPKAVTLPPIGDPGEVGEESYAPKSLATVPGPADTAWTIRLLGGESALRGVRQFILQPSPSNGAPQWGILLKAQGQEAASVQVARLWRDQDALMFQWLKDASSPANYLRNCLLEIRVGDEPHVMALRRPVGVRTIPFDLSKGQSSVNIPADWIHDSTQLRLEVLNVEGWEHWGLKPNEPVGVKDPASVTLWKYARQGREGPALEFRASFVLRRPRVLVDLRLQNPPLNQIRQLKPEARAGLEKGIAALRKEIPNARPEGKKRPLEQKLEAAEAQLWYDQAYQAIHRRTRLHFRVFMEVEGHRVDLAATRPGARPAESAPDAE